MNINECILHHHEIKHRLDEYPSLIEILSQVLISMILEDFIFYLSHRLLHTTLCYKYIHKIHHEHNNTFSFSSVFAHPLEYAIGNVLPFSAGYKFL